MPFKISESYLTSHSAGSFGQSRAGRAAGKHDGAIKQAASIVITGGTAFGLGYLEGKTGMPKVPKLGWSWDIVGGVGAHAIIGLGKMFAPPKYTNWLDKKAMGVSAGDAIETAANASIAYWAGIQGALKGGAKITQADGTAVTGQYQPRAMNQGMPSARAGMTPEQVWSGQFR